MGSGSPNPVCIRSIAIPYDLHLKLKQLAITKGVSINKLIISAIASYIERATQ